MITRIQATRYRCFEALDVALGPVVMLVGRNGAGKSTLLDIPVLIGELLASPNATDAFFKSTGTHRRPRADTGEDLVFNRQGNFFALALELSLPDEIVDRVDAKFVRYELAFTVDQTAVTVSHEAVLLFTERPSIDALPSQAEVFGRKDIQRRRHAGAWGDEILDRKESGVRSVLTREANGQTEYRIELRVKKKSFSRVGVSTKPNALALSFLPGDLETFAACNWLRSFLQTECCLYQPDLTVLRTAQPRLGPDLAVAPDASNLAWSVLDLQNAPARLADWVMHVQSALPHVSNIEARQREDDRMAYVRLRYDNDLPVPAHGLSDGTLNVLAYTILPFLSKVPRFLAVEEPENGIHPKALSTILESLSALAPTQVVISTHSPIAVAATEIDRLYCLRREANGAVTVTRGDDHETLRGWKGLPDLGSLFAADIL